MAHRSTEIAVRNILDTVGREVVLGLPLGVGKPVPLVNALYERACNDPEIHLRILTGLSMAPPSRGTGLARRLLEPLVTRIYGGRPVLDYAVDRRRGVLPDNVEVLEFYLSPGELLNAPRAQQEHLSSNYTHAARDFLAQRPNVVAQLVAPHPEGADRVSLGSNPDLTLDLLPAVDRGDIHLVGQTNPQMPYFGGDAELERSRFAEIVEGPAYDLMGPPNPPLDLVDWAVGLQASSLVRDGGTLQLGIGSLADAVAGSLVRRHDDNGAYRAMLADLGVVPRPGIGDAEPFEEGLFANTEMLSPAFLGLLEAGVLSRRADGQHVVHGGFFVGSSGFYRRLRTLSPAERDRFRMTSVSWVNELYGDERTKRAQRRHARFVNQAMMVTGLGAAVSDGLEDGRVVSGVGGQYNFVSMAHELVDGRSVLMLPSTRRHDGEVESNLRWSYGHCTIPRHLRDLVVTEYGVADLRGKPDEAVVKGILSITDARFQPALQAAAVRAGKLSADFEIPRTWRANRPERIERALASHRDAGRCPTFPWGSELTEVEATLGRALRRLKGASKRRRLPGLDELGAIVAPPESARPYLERMQLDTVDTPMERLQRWGVLWGLRQVGAI